MAESTTVGTYGPYGGKSKRNFYIGLFQAMKTTRSSYDTHWKEIADFLLPRRMRLFASDRNKGDRRNTNIIDSTGRFAARTLLSGMHSGLSSPARPWFKLGTPDRSLEKRPAVRSWLFDVTMSMYDLFATTNLYQSLPGVYGDLGTFATGAMSMLEDSDDLFRTYTYPIGSYVVGLDRRGRVTTFIREYELSVREIVEEFGGEGGRPIRIGQPISWRGISSYVKTAWEKGEYEQPVQLMWVVAPNPEHRTDRLESKYKRWTSCHFEIGSDEAAREETVLRESGFDTFPVFVPRWDITGEDAYGTDAPGMIALGDVKQLQSMQRQKGRLLAKAIDPPLRGPSQLRTQKTSLLPGDITYTDVRDGNQGLAPIHEVRLEGYQHLVVDVQDVRQLIRRAYFEDLFLMLAQSDPYRGAQPITAEEVRERHEEKLLALGPVLERANDELLEPIIDRTFALMLANGLVPPAPPELRGVNLRVEFVSILAQAQKLIGVAQTDRFLSTVLPLAEVLPDVKAKLNGKRIVDSYREALGVDPDLVRSDDEADALLEQEGRMAAAAQQAMVAKDSAAAAKAASETSLEGNTALSALLRGGSAA